MSGFLVGALAVGYAVAGLFFLRFWKESRDRLFLLFACAFFLLTLNRFVMGVFGEDSEHSLMPYMVRLIAYLIILGAIVDKNLSRG